MQTEIRHVILDHFCKKRSLQAAALSKPLQDMICAVTAPYFDMIGCLDRLDMKDPTGGLLAKFVDRTYGTVAGGLALVAIGHVREAEILSRSIFEAGATLLYIAEKESQLRFTQFFKAYVKQERDQNQKWKNDVGAEEPNVRDAHLRRIRQKDEDLARYENFIDLFAKHFNLQASEINNWPKLIDRLTHLNRRIDYRTVYAAMCSQAHHDAEDVLNHFLVNSLETGDDMSASLERETDTFSIFMVLFGLKYFVEALSAVGKRLRFAPVVGECRNSLARINEELQIIGRCLDTARYPSTWAIRKAGHN